MPWPYNSCSKCCMGMKCGDGGQPATLTGTASVGGSCPNAVNTPLSQTVTLSGASCADWFDGLACGGEPATCDCEYFWEIGEADKVTCRPQIDHIFLQCQSPGSLELAEGCDHDCYQKGIWFGEIGVINADLLVRPPGPCAIDAGTGHFFCPTQSCDDCTFSDVDYGTDPADIPADRCCPTCPPCFNCASHNAARCAANLQCCQTAGCEPCPDCPGGGGPCQGDCVQCTHCWFDATGDPTFESCSGCSFAYSQRLYRFWGYNCSGGAVEIKGCCPKSCPPDADNYSDFHLKYDCGGGDSLEFTCPEMMGRVKIVRSPREAAEGYVGTLTDEEVEAMLKKLEG